MASEQDSGLSTLLSFLKQRSDHIKRLEREAYVALYDNKDEQQYRALMVERAEAIAALDADSEEAFASVEEPLLSGVQSRLRMFAKGGRNALRLESIFYMSALLYPDEHVQGEPDNLERLISELESD